jgi:hypothetical protein
LNSLQTAFLKPEIVHRFKETLFQTDLGRFPNVQPTNTTLKTLSVPFLQYWSVEIFFSRGNLQPQISKVLLDFEPKCILSISLFDKETRLHPNSFKM